MAKNCPICKFPKEGHVIGAGGELYHHESITQSAPQRKMNRKCVYQAEYMADNRAVQVLVIASDTREAFNKVDKMTEPYKKTHWGEVIKLEFIGFVEGEE